MPDQPAAILLRLEPHMLPGLIAAYTSALQELSPMVARLSRTGRVPRAWMADPVTEQITARFNEHAVEGSQSAYTALRIYERELQNILDALRRMEADYRSTEDTAAALMGRQ